MARILIVGRRSPGLAYERTRHNMGFMAVDAYAQEQGGRFRRTRYGLVAEVDRGWILKPQTFMNRSGDAVRPFCRYFRVSPDDVVVVADDLDLPLGTLRLRRSGSSGGHNGLKSVAQSLGTEDFPRLRIGIARPDDGTPVIDWVLGRLAGDEWRTAQIAIHRSAEALDFLAQEGIDKAMSRFNGPITGRE
jgi:PTH1 family peptidyl-tRNA hydrolase